MASLLELDGVEKIYDSGDVEVRALAGVTLEIQEREFVAIMGASGSGKSTLMNILGCLDRPTTGSYRVNGVEVSKLDRDELAALRNRALGFVFQSFNLLTRTTALENVELPLLYGGVAARERSRLARAALERVGLGERMMHHPNQLSGGQQQRVAIARALVANPKIILADEPTGNLDSKTGVEIMTLFRTLADAGITIILVTHEWDVAEYARRLITMKDGLVLSDERRTPSAIAAHDAREASA